MTVATLPAAAPRARRLRASLRLIVPLASALLLAGAMLAGTLVSERQTRDLLIAESRARLALEAELLARASASAMLEGFPELTLQPILRDMLRGRGDLSTAMVIDRQGRILADPDTRRIGQRVPVPGDDGLAVGGARLREEGASFVAVMPIRHASGTELGHAIVVMPRAPLERALAAARVRQWWIAAFLVLASGLLTFTLMSRLLKPVTRLREGLERIGRGDLETRLALRDSTELGLLADTLDEMAGRLSVAQRNQLERERLAAELEAAGRIQTALRPPGEVRRGPYVVGGYQRPAAEVGGDYFDVMELPDGRLGLAIADVSGKGLAGCLVTFMLAALVRTLREHESSPARLLLEVDRHLRPVLARGAFVTVWYGVLDPLTGDLAFASAGHLPTFVRRADGRVERHVSRGVPLGVLTPAAVQKGLVDARVRLEPGDTILQLTDGFTEAERASDAEQFGFEGVESMLARSAELDVERTLGALCQRVNAWTADAIPADDQTAIVVRREPAAAARPQDATPGVDEAPMAARRFEAEDAEAWLARARAQGPGLRLRADLAELEKLRPWLESSRGPGPVPSCAGDLIESALYEVCGNVIEHGYGADGTSPLELWWLPESADEGGVRGHFVLAEAGRVFDLSKARPADLAQLEARLKGRGLGVSIVRRLVPGLRYRPGTSAGNVTLLDFDSQKILDLLKGAGDARCA